ncbi:DMT family transporter [Kouleothrix sp.]|uniref:DMT family transporter n=1 Tax=Kouleothrix sp. TaxID=2779161 RepID=UPI003918DF54
MATDQPAEALAAAPAARAAGGGLAPYLVLSGGVLMVAAASIMIRGAQQLGMPSPTIAALRLGFAALVILPLALLRARAELRALTRRDLLLGVGAGACLAAHFFAWITSLEYTSVASSAALVTTSPLWLGLAAWLMRERLARLTWLGIVCTMAGSIVIGLSDGSGGNGRNALLGDALALLGAVAVAAYFLVGRAIQRRLSTLAYVALVYTSAALVATGLALLASGGNATAVFGGFAPAAYLLGLALGLGPQLLGHTALNWSLRHLSPTFVAIATLGEPIGSALLALLFFGQWFKPLQLAGFLVLLVGILIAARGERSKPAE